MALLSDNTEGQDEAYNFWCRVSGFVMNSFFVEAATGSLPRMPGAAS